VSLRAVCKARKIIDRLLHRPEGMYSGDLRVTGRLTGNTYFRCMTIRIKRIYEPKAKTDGCRILVDRVWPRGMKKEDAHLDHWMKEVAPSTALRKWFAHDPEKWSQFRKKYHAELKKNSSSLEELLDAMHTCKTVTLLFSAKDEEHNQAIALRDYLLEHLPKAKS
jgi:uncharacterized protein YeaO (DUF488 family)